MTASALGSRRSSSSINSSDRLSSKAATLHATPQTGPSAASLSPTPSPTPVHAHDSAHAYHAPPHASHTPAHYSASGEAVQGNPQDAGGLNTSHSRGNILVPLHQSQAGGLTANSPAPASSSPVDLLSVASQASSRPNSPSAPSSPLLGTGTTSPPRRTIAAAAAGLASPARSRPTSPAQSPKPGHVADLSASILSQQSNASALSSNSVGLDPSAVFERDVEFAQDHLLTGSEALDLAAAPVLSEVALAVTGNDLSPPGSSSAAIPAQSLASTMLSSSSALPPNAYHAPSQPILDVFDGPTSSSASNTGFALPSPSSILPLSEQLRRSSHGAQVGGGSSGPRPTMTAGARPLSGEFSPPPSLSLSPSASGSPMSSAPGSPVQAFPSHPGQGAGSLNPATAAAAGGTATPSSGTQFEHYVPFPDSSIIETVGPPDLETTLPSPPGSATSGISLSGAKEGKRRLSMISYADIINSERLSDTHSGVSSPTPSSAALSMSALPAHGLATGGSGSAIYSPVTSPERDLSPALESAPLSPFAKKPVATRSDTADSQATARGSSDMPGQLPLGASSPGLEGSHDGRQEGSQDITPTSSTIRKGQGSGAQQDDLASSTSSWSMVEMGKALVGSAAGAVDGLLGTGLGAVGDPKDVQPDATSRASSKAEHTA